MSIVPQFPCNDKLHRCILGCILGHLSDLYRGTILRVSNVIIKFQVSNVGFGRRSIDDKCRIPLDDSIDLHAEHVVVVGDGVNGPGGTGGPAEETWDVLGFEK